MEFISKWMTSKKMSCQLIWELWYINTSMQAAVSKRVRLRVYEFDLSLVPQGNAKLHSERKVQQKLISSGKKRQN